MKKEISYLEKLKMIDEIKKIFERQLEIRLKLIKVQSPLFVKSDSGLQDDLTGKEKAVSFESYDERFEIIHSLAKWKRDALGKYHFPMHTGLYTEMRAIRKDEDIDEVHSLFVEQWDWEKVISKEDRSIEYLKETVRSIYKALRQTLITMKQKYHFLTLDLPKTITFISSQELEDLYPDKTPKERERLISKEKKAIFIIGIGDKLKSGIIHDHRSPDYDDWQMDGDLLIYDKAIDREIEISSMGIRVDKKSLISQLEKLDLTEKLKLPFQQKIMKEKLPFTIGGGIGISRVLMLIMESAHIAQVHTSTWDSKTLKKLKDQDIL